MKKDGYYLLIITLGHHYSTTSEVDRDLETKMKKNGLRRFLNSVIFIFRKIPKDTLQKGSVKPSYPSVTEFVEIKDMSLYLLGLTYVREVSVLQFTLYF